MKQIINGISYDMTEGEIDEFNSDEATRKNKENAILYKEKRRFAYKSIAEQLDMIYWDKVNKTTNWYDHIAFVKTQYPKP